MKKVNRVRKIFSRASAIYFSYKANTISNAIWRQGDLEKRTEILQELHEINSDRMLNMCLDLRGFFIKAGQFLSTRQDFMPAIYCKKLGVLCDDVPPLSKEEVEVILNRELSRCDPKYILSRDQGPSRERRAIHWEDVFKTVDMEKPLGSASIAQVHQGILHTGDKVAIKLQNPLAEQLMGLDLECLKHIAGFLCKTGEIKFDLLSAVNELKFRILEELDFRKEANTMSRARQELQDRVSGIKIPHVIPGLVTQRLITMSLLEGKPLSAIASDCKKVHVRRSGVCDGDSKENLELPNYVKIIGKQLLERMTETWGIMVMEHGHFHADPHPGNIMITPTYAFTGWLNWVNWLPFHKMLPAPPSGFELGILDWGQVKSIDDDFRQSLGRLLIAVADADQQRIAKGFESLGIKVRHQLPAGGGHRIKFRPGICRTLKTSKSLPGQCLIHESTREMSTIYSIQIALFTKIQSKSFRRIVSSF